MIVSILHNTGCDRSLTDGATLGFLVADYSPGVVRWSGIGRAPARQLAGNRGGSKPSDHSPFYGPRAFLHSQSVLGALVERERRSRPSSLEQSARGLLFFDVFCYAKDIIANCIFMRRFFIFLVIIIVAFIAYWVFRRPLEAPTVSENPFAPLASSIQSERDKVERVAESVSSKDAAGLTSENIRVTSPKPNDKLTSPFTVVGEARVFENVVNIRVTNAKGEAFITETAYAHAPDAGQFGAFSINLSYKFKNTKEGFVEVYHASAKDGSDQDLIRIPVMFE